MPRQPNPLHPLNPLTKFFSFNLRYPRNPRTNLLTVAACLLTSTCSTNPEEISQSSIVWKAGDNGRAVYHVHGLALLPDGNLLAFSEGRLARGDHAAHDIVMKRSSDGGRTWHDEFVVAVSDSGQSYANPTPVVDRRSGRVFLFYGENHESQSSDVFVRSSDDGGGSWGGARRLTHLFADDPLKRPFHLPGPGHGIQLRSGRLVVPVWHRYGLGPEGEPAERRQYAVNVIYSDDGGESWAAGGYTSTSLQLNESRVVELADGELRLNARLAGEMSQHRATALSRDGGASWSEPVIDSTLSPAFPTDGGYVRWGRVSGEVGKEVHALVRPAAAEKRRDLTLSLSINGGATWSRYLLISSGSAYYSDLVELPDGSLGVLYGADGSDAPDPWLPSEIRFVRIAPEDVLR